MHRISDFLSELSVQVLDKYKAVAVAVLWTHISITICKRIQEYVQTWNT